MIAGANLEQQLQTILSRLLQDRFGNRDAPQVTVTDGTGICDDGTLYGAIEIRIRKRDGDMALLHRQSLDGIRDTQALKNAVAAALSQVLANHANWPH